ncbi:MAG: sigma-70 family RNA polymerase sigma factor [Acidobacteriota bacterium]|nr:sigma-70 family RNA polymerase sigma factor [Acidobacteriota bacterium]MDE3191503.1 sigma-70 family RNA polymerase sigma factor [Acidobacteriota bacterium]
MTAADERTLVVRAAGGDGAAFEQLIELHGRRTYRMLVRIVGDPSDAEDVLQETFLKAWRALPRFRGQAQFSTWLYRIAVNEANRRLARERRHRSLPLEDTLAEVPDLEPGPPAHAESVELQELVAWCISELPAQYREAVVLRDIEGLTNEEAAEALGLTVRNFKSRLHRGRMGIRRMLEQHQAR